MTGLRRHWRYTLDIVYYGDSTHTRWWIALISICWGLSMLGDPALFDRPIQRPMAAMVEVPVAFVGQFVPWLQLPSWITPAPAWGAAFIVYGLASFWRIYDKRTLIVVARVVSFAGAGLWAAMALALTVGIGRFTLVMTAEWLLTVQLALAAVRTALNDEIASP